MKENYTALYPNEHVNKAVGDYSAEHSTKLPQHIVDHHSLMSETQQHPEMMSSPFQSQFQFWLARVAGAKRVLEVGCFVGFSAMAWSYAVGSDGHVTTLEFDQAYANVAKESLAKNRIENVDVIVGDARESLKTLGETITEPYDLVFIDADKVSYPTYFSLLMSNSDKDSSKVRLLRPGALIVADNVLRRGLVADATENNPNFNKLHDEYRSQALETLRSLDEFNNMMVNNRRLDTFLLPLFDGLGMGRLVD